MSKLTDSDGELQETRHWMGRSLAYGYITSEVHTEVEARCDSVGAMLGKIMQSPRGFT